MILASKSGQSVRELPLERGKAAALASAWVSYQADKLGVRMLVIKGPGAAYLGLRDARLSADVDVLVEPGGISALVERCKIAGWVERFAPTAPEIQESHSITLIHPGWPIDLDLHKYWPGFLADRTQVFNDLWLHRLTWNQAAVDVHLPDVASTALILALHSLRRPRAERKSATLEILAKKARHVMGPDVSEILLDRCRSLGCMETARPFLEMTGASYPNDDHQYADSLRRWRLTAETTGHTDAWMLAIMAAPFRVKPALLWRALFPSEAELRGLHPELSPGRLALIVGWERRFANGLRAAPHALRSISRAKRSQNRDNPVTGGDTE